MEKNTISWTEKIVQRLRHTLHVTNPSLANGTNMVPQASLGTFLEAPTSTWVSSVILAPQILSIMTSMNSLIEPSGSELLKRVPGLSDYHWKNPQNTYIAFY